MPRKASKKATKKKTWKSTTKKPAPRKRVGRKAAPKKRAKKNAAKKSAPRKKIARKASPKKSSRKRTQKKEAMAKIVSSNKTIEETAQPLVTPIHFEVPADDRLRVVAPIVKEELTIEEIEGKDLAYHHKQFILHISVGVLMVAILFFWVRTIRAHIENTLTNTQIPDQYVKNIKENLDSLKLLSADTAQELQAEPEIINEILTKSERDTKEEVEKLYKQEITTQVIKVLEQVSNTNGDTANTDINADTDINSTNE